MRRVFGILVAAGMVCGAAAAQGRSTAGHRVDVWRTSGDRTAVLRHERIAGGAGAAGEGEVNIAVDPAKRYQSVDGFGFAMTGGSAQVLHGMSAAKRHALLQELFGKGAEEDGISYLRVSIGASDMNDHVYTYDDLPEGQSDAKLEHFSLGEDMKDVIPVMKEVLQVNPRIGILASPWTAPAWMKTNGAVKGGSLRPEMYGVYAQYLVRYLQEMAKAGVPIATMTIQNEPLNPKNTPSMVMEAAEEERFLRDDLGPAMRAAGLKTGVVLFDHNCNHPEYPMSILADGEAAQYAVGSGFHLYEGEIGALSQVHDAYPGKGLYFTEQMVVERAALGRGSDDTLEPVARPVARVVIGATRNWSRTVLLWNLAADRNYGPHTNDGGCPVCQGAITVDGDTVSRNIALYTIAQVSRFVPPGSVRVDSSESDAEVKNVVFRTPAGRLVAVVTNNGAEVKRVRVTGAGPGFTATLGAGEVATFSW